MTTTTPPPAMPDLIHTYPPEMLAAAMAKAGLSPAPSAPPVPEPPQFFAFHPPSYFENYVLPPDAILVGDCHLTRGSFTVIAGVAGTGKSRLLISLAIAGKRGAGATWMGLPVNANFRTAILQSENGEVRLKQELMEVHANGHDLDGWLHITPPPPFGLAFQDPIFREQLRAWLAETKPGVIAIDPWNCCVPDDKARDYRTVLNALKELLPEGDARPAVIIIHHLRKPQGEFRKRGRELLAELSGSYVIGSAARAVFVLEHATQDVVEDRVVFTCTKNNDGKLGPATAWRRKSGLFEAIEDFDWEEWNGDHKKSRRGVELEDLQFVFENGVRRLTRKQAVAAIVEKTGLRQSTVYHALRAQGPYAHLLHEHGEHLVLDPDPE